MPTPLSSLLPIKRVAGLPGVDLVLGTTGYLTFRVVEAIRPSLAPILPGSWAKQEHASERDLLEGEGDDDERRPLLVPSNEDLAVPLAHGQAWSKGTTVPTLLLGIMYALLLVMPLPAPISLSTPISTMTPLSIGCVLPARSHLSPIDNLVHASETLGPHAKLIVWPESALVLDGDENERAEAIDKVHREVSARYRVWVMMGLESVVGDRRRNEAVLVGPDGLIGSYEKQKLVPCEYVSVVSVRAEDD